MSSCGGLVTITKYGPDPFQSATASLLAELPGRLVADLPAAGAGRAVLRRPRRDHPCHPRWPPPSSTPAPGPGSGDGPSLNTVPAAGALLTLFKERSIRCASPGGAEMRRPRHNGSGASIACALPSRTVMPRGASERPASPCSAGGCRRRSSSHGRPWPVMCCPSAAGTGLAS